MARPLTLALAVAATLLALALTLGLQPAAFATHEQAAVVAWSLIATSGDAQRAADALLCDDATPCEAATLDARAAAGDRCALRMEVELHPLADHPIALRDTAFVLHADVTRGDLRDLPNGSRNLTHESATFPHPQAPSTWWRGSSRHVHAAVPVPCDASEVRLTLNLRGESWRGGAYERAWSVEVDLRPDLAH